MTDTITEKLIATVQQYPILYDVSHPEYKNIRKKDKVWDGIGVELGTNGKKIQTYMYVYVYVCQIILLSLKKFINISLI